MHHSIAVQTLRLLDENKIYQLGRCLSVCLGGQGTWDCDNKLS
jgi:hypothetical protein